MMELKKNSIKKIYSDQLELTCHIHNLNYKTRLTELTHNMGCETEISMLKTKHISIKKKN